MEEFIQEILGAIQEVSDKVDEVDRKITSLDRKMDGEVSTRIKLSLEGYAEHEKQLAEMRSEENRFEKELLKTRVSALEKEINKIKEKLAM